MSTTPTPTISGSFTVQQLSPGDPIHILGPAPQNRFIARIEEGTIEDAHLLAASRELLQILKFAVWQWENHKMLGPLLHCDAKAIIARLEPSG